jgi:hypothetical protein
VEASLSPRRFVTPLALVVVLAAAPACGRGDQAATLTELQRIKSGALNIVLLSRRDALHRGKDTFVIEFRTSDERLVDVGNVRASANMPMAGTPMFGTVDVMPTAVAGRYEASSEFSMAGTWRLTIQWDGPAGQGSVTVAGTVQ